ncbi:MAG: NAD(P)-dependent oxidoreductase [Aestuariivirga sp.]
MPINILICDPVGLTFDEQGKPDASAVKAHVETKGGTFHMEGLPKVGGDGSFHFYYHPDISTREEILAIAGSGQFDALIAAATLIPPEAKFRLGGVRIGAGTGNMGSTSWGGPNGIGGTAPLMNTPGFNARATAQMVMKALLHFRPNLPFDVLHDRVISGSFDTGKNLREFPTAKLEGQTMAIIGYGNIGHEVAKLVAAFGMRVKIYARASHHARILAEGFTPASSVVDAAASADVISVHTGLGTLEAATGRYANQGIVDAQVLQALAKGATVLNFDRGECVDAGALADVMSSGQVSNAAVDADIFTIGGEVSGPMAPYLPLAHKFGKRILLLPHAAADTDHPSRVAGAKQAVDQIFEAILNKRVVNRKGDLPPGYTDGGSKLGV